jgi:hypothetical protein
MRRRSIQLLGLLFVVSTGAILWTGTRPDCPVEVEFVGLETASDPEQKWVELALEFTRRGPDFECYAKGLTVQAMVEGRWSKPEVFLGLISDVDLWLTNRVHVAFMIPRHTKACRFVVAYHIRGSPNVQAHIFLFNHGWMQKFPRVCNWVLRAFPERVQWKRATLQVTLPRPQHETAWPSASSHNKALQTTAASLQVIALSGEMAKVPSRSAAVSELVR